MPDDPALRGSQGGADRNMQVAESLEILSHDRGGCPPVRVVLVAPVDRNAS